MASAREELEELRRLEEELGMLRQVNSQELDRMNQSISAQVEGSRRILEQENQLGQVRANNEALAKRLAKIRDDQHKGLVRLTAAEEARVKAQEEMVDETRQELALREKQLGFMRSQLDTSKAIAGSIHEWVIAGKAAMIGFFAAIPGLLIEADTQMRLIAQNTGMGANNMGRMRDSISEAAMGAAALGASTKELLQLQEQYMGVTGKMQVLSASHLKSMTAVAEGTSLGYEGTAKMAGQMELIGYNAKDTADWIGTAVNHTEAMGLNSAKVLQTMSQTIDKARGFSFQSGMGKGIELMAQQAERLKVSVEGTFAAADKARTLEGSLNMASSLAVLGGNFAKADPFKLSFLARNDPAKFQAALADMTKGMATFNRETGEMGVSAYNMDRLRAAAEATGQPLDDLVKSATEAGKSDLLKGQLFVGTKEQREMILSMAQIGKNGRATISLEGKDIDISKLTGEHIRALQAEKMTLEERAKQAQGFDKVFSTFVDELKATAMPLLEATNSLLKGVHTAMDGLRGVVGEKGMRWIVGLTAGAFALSKAFSVGQTLMGLGGAGGGGKGLFSTIISKLGFGGKGGAPPVPPSTGSKAGNLLGGAGGMGSAATIAAVGVAAVGVGFGFKLAAEGAATFATALQKLNPEQLASMERVLLGLGIGIIGVTGAMVLMGSMAGNPVTALGIGVIAAGVMGIGFGAKLAADGMAGFTNSLANLGNVDMSKLGGFFAQVAGFLAGDSSNLDHLVESVNALSEKSQDNLVDRLEKLWNTPLKLEASNATFHANIEITNLLDGEKYVNKYAKKFQAAIVQGSKGQRSLS